MEEIQIEKPIENWTKFPNNILDNLDKFESSEFKIIGLMVRKNLGYQNPDKRFSLRYIVLKTGLSKQTVITALTGLEEKKSITKTIGKNGIGIYEISWSKPSSGQEIRPPAVKKLDHRVVKKLDHRVVKKLDQLKENIINKTIVKENKEKNSTPPLPDTPDEFDLRKKEYEEVKKIISENFKNETNSTYNDIQDDQWIYKIVDIVKDDFSQVNEKLKIWKEKKNSMENPFWKKSQPTAFYLVKLWNELIPEPKRDNRGGYVPRNNI